MGIHLDLDDVSAGHPKAIEELANMREWANDAASALAVFMTLGADAPHEAWFENAVRTARLLNMEMPNPIQTTKG